MTALHLLEREIGDAFELWCAFADTRSAYDWRAYTAAYRRVLMVGENTGINFRLGKPVLRVKAFGVPASDG